MPHKSGQVRAGSRVRDNLEYSIERVADSEQQRADTTGFGTTKQGLALVRKYLPQLEENIAADRRSGRRDKDVWLALKDVEHLAERLLIAGITVCADDQGTDRYGRKNYRDIALFISDNLGQEQNEQGFRVGVWGVEMLSNLPLFDRDDDDLLTLPLTVSLDGFLNDVLGRVVKSNPLLLPLDTPPVPWTQVNRGGLPSTHWAQVPLVKDKASQAAWRSEIAIRWGEGGGRNGLWQVLDAINWLQGVAFVINDPVLNVARQMPPELPAKGSKGSAVAQGARQAPILGNRHSDGRCDDPS
jgi:hypothetical protein